MNYGILYGHRKLREWLNETFGIERKYSFRRLIVEGYPITLDSDIDLGFQSIEIMDGGILTIKSWNPNQNKGGKLFLCVREYIKIHGNGKIDLEGKGYNVPKQDMIVRKRRGGTYIHTQQQHDSSHTHVSSPKVVSSPSSIRKQKSGGKSPRLGGGGGGKKSPRGSPRTSLRTSPRGSLRSSPRGKDQSSALASFVGGVGGVGGGVGGGVAGSYKNKQFLESNLDYGGMDISNPEMIKQQRSAPISSNTNKNTKQNTMIYGMNSRQQAMKFVKQGFSERITKKDIMIHGQHERDTDGDDDEEISLDEKEDRKDDRNEKKKGKKGRKKGKKDGKDWERENTKEQQKDKEDKDKREEKEENVQEELNWIDEFKEKYEIHPSMTKDKLKLGTIDLTEIIKKKKTIVTANTKMECLCIFFAWK